MRVDVQFLTVDAASTLAITDPYPLSGEGEAVVSDPTRLLVARLRHLLSDADRRVCILLGAGASVPFVPSVAELTRQAFAFADRWGAVRAPSSSAPPPSTSGVQEVRIDLYTEALQLIQHVRGGEGVRAFVQRACLNAYNGHEPFPLPDRPLSDRAFSDLVRETANWRIPDGLQALANVLNEHGGQVDQYILTTNFDPLLEIALERVGVRTRSVAFMEHDGAPADIALKEAERVVVHLHGDALSASAHSPWVLGRSRPQLERWLRDHLRRSTLLIVGYSGFDEIVHRAVQSEFETDVVVDPGLELEILWTVYEDASTHSYVDPHLADFFQMNRLAVTPYYGVDRDRLFVEVHEALGSPVGDRHSGPTVHAATSFYDLAKTLNSEFEFGLSRVKPTLVPEFAFWPHRVRRPHVIHGVHALTAVMLARLGIPVELHLDDSGMSSSYADPLVAEFEEAVDAWFEACQVSTRPTVHRTSTLLGGPDVEPAVAARLWRLANDFYSSTVSLFDALVATKVINADGDDVVVSQSPAHRLLRPLYTWLALEDALVRHDLLRDRAAPVVTLGGADEQRMWDLWRDRPGVPGVASVYVPRLEAPVLGPDLWRNQDLRRDAAFGPRDLERPVLRLAQTDLGGAELRWLFMSAIRLAFLASQGAAAGMIFAGTRVDSWYDAQEALRTDAVAASAAMTEAISSWFFHT